MQKDLAKKIGIDVALMSKLLNHQIEEFSLDRLIGYLGKLYQRVDLKIDTGNESTDSINSIEV